VLWTQFVSQAMIYQTLYRKRYELNKQITIISNFGHKYVSLSDLV